MKYILDPTRKDKIGSYRGSGRIIQTLKEKCANDTNVSFIDSLSKIPFNSELTIPFFNPFDKPILTKRLAKKQSIYIFDVIPLKYPNHFPIGIKAWINLKLNKYLLKNYDEIITISNTSKEDISKYLNIPEKKITVKYPKIAKVFTDKKYAKSKIKISNNVKNLIKSKQNFSIYVGDVNWNKNLVNLAKAIKIADVNCVFIGKMFDQKTIFSYREQFKSFTHPWLVEYKDFIKESYGNPLFHFIGYVNDNELIELYRKAKVNILISRDEGFGYSYAEAKSQNCPSVLSKRPIFFETAGKDANIKFVDPEKPNEIAKTIKEFF